MNDGNISAKTTLAQFRGRQHIYALGAVAELKGEILLLDSAPFISAVTNDTLVIKSTFTTKATLLVYAQVEKWQAISIPTNISDGEMLESFIAKSAKQAGLNPEAPFPFRLSGVARSANWHVIDWPDGDTEHTHQKHKNAGLHCRIENTPIEIVGFYSNKHQMIFTHRSRNMPCILKLWMTPSQLTSIHWSRAST